jgi:hypothetical protein
LALAAAGLLLVWTAFSASIPGSPWRFSLAYAVVEIVLQLRTIRRLDTRGVVAAIFLVLLYPYLYFAIPSLSGGAAARWVGERILRNLRKGAIEDACAFFSVEERRRDFVQEVQRHDLLQLREWSLVQSSDVWRTEGSADFRVLCEDGRVVLVEVSGEGRRFAFPTAGSFVVHD